MDLTEIPPAKGRTPTANKLLEGQVVVVQPADLLQAKRIIPDLATWLQCFAVYAAVLLKKFPERSTSLLIYQKHLAYFSQRFPWPSWAIYDAKEAADADKVDWSQVDYGLHARCFGNQHQQGDAWCPTCHSIDHLADNCLFANPREVHRKRPANKRNAAVGPYAQLQQKPVPLRTQVQLRTYLYTVPGPPHL